VRLADIDAPEKGDPDYISSTKALRDRVLGSKLFIDVGSKDIHGRYVCVLYLLSGSTYTNINYALVKSGGAQFSPVINEFDHNLWQIFTKEVDYSVAIDDSKIIFKEDDEEDDVSKVPSWAVYVGHKERKKYHLLTCSYGKSIHPDNVIYFRSKEEADGAGYAPCKICLESYYDEDINGSNGSGDSSSGDSDSDDYYNGPVIGNKNTKVFHRPTCGHINQMNPNNKVPFSSPAAARAAGYRWCKHCVN
jgi:hypothetical protein